MKIAALARAGSIVDPDTGGSSTSHIFHAQHTRPVLVGFGGAARRAMCRVVLTGDAVAGRGPRRVLHRQPGLEHARGLNQSKQQEQQHRQGHGELRQRLPLAWGVLIAIGLSPAVGHDGVGFHSHSIS